MPSCEVMRLEKALLRPKAPPPDPVSEICGKELGLSNSNFSVRSDQHLLGLANVRTAFQISDDGIPAALPEGVPARTRGSPRGTPCG